MCSNLKEHLALHDKQVLTRVPRKFIVQKYI